MTTLAEVIDRARTEWCIQYIEAWRKPDGPQLSQSDHIARAVAAFMLSDAAVERVARAVYDLEPFYMPTGQARDGIEIARKFSFDDAPAYRQTRAIEHARAAITAALAEGGKS